jgi:hypothetical protein
MKVGRDRYLRKVQKQAHIGREPENWGWKSKKAGQDNYLPTGFLENLSILRMSLSI